VGSTVSLLLVVVVEGRKEKRVVQGALSSGASNAHDREKRET
jgi:hypothetical protein